MKDEDVPSVLKEIADAGGGKVDFVSGPLSDGSGFATISFPLPENHWLYAKGYNVPPMPFRMGEKDISLLTTFTTERKTAPAPARMSRHEMADKIREAGKYAVRCATINGTEMDFDPDAMLQNLVVGMIGYWTANGFSTEDWENPQDPPVRQPETPVPAMPETHEPPTQTQASREEN